MFLVAWCIWALSTIAYYANAQTTTLRNSLPLPSSNSRVSYSQKTAVSFAKSLPGYLYNLTQEIKDTRTSICSQSTNYCDISSCADPSDKITKNFCNPDTMGWNCECDKSVSRMQAYFSPINLYDCRLRTTACLQECQNPSASPPVKSIPDCQRACSYVYGATCGNSNQVIPWYKVDKYDDVPKYFTDTTPGGVFPKSAGAATAVPLALMVTMASLVVCMV